MPPKWRDPYRPLRVVAEMAGPVAAVPGEPLLPLDGLLEYAAFTLGYPSVLRSAAREGGVRRLPRADSRDPANFCLPVKRHGHKEDPDWFWQASWAELSAGHAAERVHWNRRFDGADPALTGHLDFGGRRGNVPASCGRYKSYHMPVCLLVAQLLEWHCLGAADGVARLLREVQFLGHKRSQGLGEVRRWLVYAEREDRSLWRPGGAPARALPESYFAGGVPAGLPRMTCGLRPPYWHPSRRRACVTPPEPAPGMITAGEPAV